MKMHLLRVTVVASYHSEALVFMLVALRFHFKQPIGYVLIDKISAEMQAKLISHAIAECAQRNFIVHATVCDGIYTKTPTRAHIFQKQRSYTHCFSQYFLQPYQNAVQ